MSMQKNNFDVLFITPPIWDVHLPFAAVPQLMGACKEAGLKSMQIDLGITSYEILFRRHYKEKVKKYFSKEYYDERVAVWGNSPVKTFEEYITRISFLKQSDFSINKAKNAYKQGGMLEKGIITALTESILSFFDAKTSKGTFNVKEFFDENNSGLINDCIAQENLVPLLQSNIKVIGISVTGIVQFRYAKELITAIRKIQPSVKIVLGGSAITLAVRSNSENIEQLFELSDFLITGEGETAIVQLVKYLSSGKNISEIPGLIYKTENGIFANPSIIEDIQTVPKPSFDGIDFNRYLLPEPMFPYHTSRGCFYGHCAFCNHDSEYRHNYRQKSVEKVITEILYLVKQTGLRNVQFTDEAIEPHFFRKLVRAMEENPEFHNISWFCYLRVSNIYDDETVRLAAKNGCRMVLFGIESFQQRLLNFIKKGHNADTAKENLHLFHKHKIKTFSWFMYGLPSETIDEALNDTEAIEEVSKNLDGFAHGVFFLSPNTDMSRDTEKYNIISYDAYNGKLFTTHNNNYIINVNEVIDTYSTKIKQFKLRKYFSSNRYALYYDLPQNEVPK